MSSLFNTIIFPEVGRLEFAGITTKAFPSKSQTDICFVTSITSLYSVDEAYLITPSATVKLGLLTDSISLCDKFNDVRI